MAIREVTDRLSLEARIRLFRQSVRATFGFLTLASYSEPRFTRRACGMFPYVERARIVNKKRSRALTIEYVPIDDAGKEWEGIDVWIERIPAKVHRDMIDLDRLAKRFYPEWGVDPISVHGPEETLKAELHRVLTSYADLTSREKAIAILRGDKWYSDLYTSWD